MLCTATHPCTKARRMQAREPSLRPPDQSAGHRQCQSQIVVDAERCPTRSPADCLSDNSQHRLTESKQRKRGNMELGEKRIGSNPCHLSGKESSTLYQILLESECMG